MYNNKKGQAAMEFLMTYGWAILAAIIAIGVLAAFGVFSPGKLVQEKVVVNAPFNAKAAVVDSGVGGANISLELFNGGDPVVINRIQVAGCADSNGTQGDTVEITGLSSGFTNVVDEDNSTTVASGAQGVFKIQCNNSVTITKDSNFKGDITITYVKEGSTLSLLSTGSITAKAR